VNDHIAELVVGAVVTLGTLIITGIFAAIKAGQLLKEQTAATERSVVASNQAAVESQKAVVAVVAASAEPEKIHAAISEFDALRAETVESRVAAAVRLDRLTRES
jgi:hypothetical protein